MGWEWHLFCYLYDTYTLFCVLNYIFGLKYSADYVPSLLCLFLGIDDQIDLFDKYDIWPQDSIAPINRKVWRVWSWSEFVNACFASRCASCTQIVQNGSYTCLQLCFSQLVIPCHCCLQVTFNLFFVFIFVYSKLRIVSLWFIYAVINLTK